MLRTSFPDLLSGRTTLVKRCVVSGEAAHAAPVRNSVEQKSKKMFCNFQQ
ncbi:MAG: hypothetical protein JST11_28125 [Acidobacteria bacterium]|nr:hypothetical protein [Acidobacteriota bacterium]